MLSSASQIVVQADATIDDIKHGATTTEKITAGLNGTTLILLTAEDAAETLNLGKGSAFDKAQDGIKKVHILNGALAKIVKAFETSDQDELDRRQAIKDKITEARELVETLRANDAPEEDIQAARNQVKLQKKALKAERNDNNSELKRLKIEQAAIRAQLASGEHSEDSQRILESELQKRQLRIQEMRGGKSDRPDVSRNWLCRNCSSSNDPGRHH